MKLALVTAAVACFAQAAAAADAIEKSTFDVGPAQVSQAQLQRRIAEKFGECIARSHWLHGKAVAFLASGKERDGEKVDDMDCFTKAFVAENLEGYSQENYSVAAMRSLVADGLVRVDFSGSGPASFSAVPPLDPAGTSPAIDRLGECAARVSPEGVRQLALTDAASEAETAQLRSLVPTFAQCLPPGVTLNFSTGDLRDASVLAYARLAFYGGRRSG